MLGGSVPPVHDLHHADRETHVGAGRMLEGLNNEQLATQPAPAPWDPTPMVLGRRLLEMVYHLNTHKSQLFYYLKLMGRSVNTGNLWGA